VVALGGLLKHGEMRLELVPRSEGDARDALELRPRHVAEPVGARHAHQLEGVGRKLPRVRKVGTPAEVLPVAVPVHTDALPLGDARDELDLERLARGLVVGDGRGRAVPDLGPNRARARNDAAHLGLDLPEVLGREGPRAVEVVEPPSRSRGRSSPCLGQSACTARGHDMGEVVADQLQRALGPSSFDGDGPVRSMGHWRSQCWPSSVRRTPPWRARARWQRATSAGWPAG
jgi:hypothetical protein